MKAAKTNDRTSDFERRREMSGTKSQRRYPIGAELIGDGRVHFRVWAPKAKRLEVAVEGELGTNRSAKIPATVEELVSEPNRYFSRSAAAEAGNLYRIRLNH